MPRDDPDSEIKLWIKSNTGNGSEILIPSTSGNGTNSWVVKYRFPSRYVDELRYNHPDYSPESFEDADYGSIEETNAEQQTTQSRSQCRRFEDHILIDQRKWIDLTANEYNHKYQLEPLRFSKFVMRLVRHMDLQERESDSSLEIDRSEATTRVTEGWKRYLL